MSDMKWVLRAVQQMNEEWELVLDLAYDYYRATIETKDPYHVTLEAWRELKALREKHAEYKRLILASDYDGAHDLTEQVVFADLDALVYNLSNVREPDQF